jgi:peroxiredoxin 2/4
MILNRGDMLLIGKKAPDFTCNAAMADNSVHSSFNFHEHIHNKKAILFFYPLDFTFVCPSEIIALNNKLDAFRERDVVVMIVSIDSHFSHIAYKNTKVEHGGIGHVRMPMLSDITKNISTEYGVLADGGMSFRGTFLIDKHKVIRHQSINDFPIGRNINELIRLVDALEHAEQYGEVCPAGWKKGDKAIKPTSEGIAIYLEMNSDNL